MVTQINLSTYYLRKHEIEAVFGEGTAQAIKNEIDKKANLSHNHGNLQNNGQVGETVQANKNVVTDSNGKIITEDKYTHPSYTARTGKPTGNQTPAFGGTATVSQITSDATGHVTGATDRTITIPSNTATTSANGLMSKNDKSKLDGITASADAVSFTPAKTSGIEIGTLTINGTDTKLYQQDNNTTYSAVTQSANGLMTKEDKQKVDKSMSVGFGTAAGTTSAYTVSITGVTLTHGTVIALYNAVGVNAASATLNVNDLGAKPIYYKASAIPASRIPSQVTVLLMYNTTIISTGCWQLIYSYDSNNTYTAASATPNMDGTAAVGTSAKYAREDHIHPTDTSRAAASHTHDDRYYTETEVNTKLSGKSDTNHNHDGTYLKSYTPPTASTSQAGIVQLNSATNSTSTTQAATPSAVKSAYDLASNKTVTLTKLSTATTGYIATYEIKQGSTSLGKIDIPKDYLVKSGSVKTVSTANNPVSGYAVGDKYIDFVINTKENDGTDEHIYINVKDLIDTYTAGTGLNLSNNQFSVKLNSATNSTSTTEAATPSAVKSAYDLANGKAPTNHASTGTGYGVATTANYGHTKIVQNLTTKDGNGLALGAGQGKALKEQIDGIIAGTIATDHNHDGSYIKTGTGTVTSDNIANGTIIDEDIASDAAIDFSKLDITKADIVGLGIPSQDTNTTYTASTMAGGADTTTGTKGTSNAYARADHTHKQSDLYLDKNTEFGGTNLLDGTQDFTGITNGTITNETYKDCKVIRYNNTSGTTYVDCTWNDMPLVGEFNNGDKFTLSFWAKGTGSIICYSYGYSGYLGAKPIKSSNGINLADTYGDGHCTFTLSEGWKRYYVTWEFNPISDGLDVKKRLLIRTLSGADAYYSGVMFERGEIAHDWSPSPYELADNSVSTAKIIDGAITSDKIANYTITNDDIATKTITGNRLADGTITTIQITNGTIKNEDISNSAAIDFSKLNITKANITGLGIPASDTNTTYSTVTTSTNGLMSASDKIKLDTLTNRYDGNFIGGVGTVTKPYLRLFNITSKASSSSSSHIIFEIIGNNNDRLYAKIRVDIRQNDTTSESSTSSYTITPLEVYGFNLNQLYFGFYDNHMNKQTVLDIYRKVGAYVNFYIRIYDDHLRDGTYTMFKPVANGTESYTDLDEAATSLYNITYTDITQGNEYRVVENTLPNTIFTGYMFKKNGGTSSQFLKADGSVDNNTYLTSHQDISGKVDKVSGKGLSTNDYTTEEKNKLNGIATGANKTIVDSSLSTSSTNPVQNKVINTALNTKNITVSKQSSADTGYAATYIIKQNGTQVGEKINIPKDLLVKSASLKTCTTANSPLSGLAVNDPYLDFVINSADNSVSDAHIYINVKDLVDTYTAGTGITLSNNAFSVKYGTTSGTACQGNDSRLTNTRTPTDNSVSTAKIVDGAVTTDKIADGTIKNEDIASDAAIDFSKLNITQPNITGLGISSSSHSHGNITNIGAIGSTPGCPIITTTNGRLAAGSFGTVANTFCQGNDTRLSDARTPIFNKIPASSSSTKDLDDYTTGGFYYCNGDNAVAPYIENQPLSTNRKAFFLLVETWGTSSTYVKQTLTYYHNNTTYTRTKSGSNGWKNWAEISNSNSRYYENKGNFFDLNEYSHTATTTETTTINENYSLNNINNWIFSCDVKISGAASSRVELSPVDIDRRLHISFGKNSGGNTAVWWGTNTTNEASTVFSDITLDESTYYHLVIVKDNINVKIYLDETLLKDIDLSWLPSYTDFRVKTTVWGSTNGISIKNIHGNSYSWYIEIPNSVDLDNYTALGFYGQPANKNTTNITNLPENRHTAFTLLVENFGDYAKQTLTFLDLSSPSTYIRVQNWDKNSWSTWQKIAWADHTHGSINNNGQLNSDITSINKIAVTDSSNNLKTISKVPFAKLNISKSDITGLGIPSSDTNTTYSAGTGLSLSGTTFSLNLGTTSGTAAEGNHTHTGWILNKSTSIKNGMWVDQYVNIELGLGMIKIEGSPTSSNVTVDMNPLSTYLPADTLNFRCHASHLAWCVVYANGTVQLRNRNVDFGGTNASGWTCDGHGIYLLASSLPS